MSTRLTHHRRSLSDRLNAWLEARANDRLLAAAQRAEDALSEARHTIRTLQAQHARAMENTRAEFLAAQASMERDIERSIEVERRLCQMANVPEAYALSLHVTVESEWTREETHAEARSILSRAFPEDQS